jgi:hypothetical protein
MREKEKTKFRKEASELKKKRKAAEKKVKNNINQKVYIYPRSVRMYYKPNRL